MDSSKQEYYEALAANADRWVAAGGGEEKPTLHRDGRVYLYVYNPARREHGWLDVETDIVQHQVPFWGGRS